MGTDIGDTGRLSPALLKQLHLRILPLVVAGFFMAFLDRVNMSFAALTMNHDLGISATLFGWGAGIFFISYFIFEVPSNVLLVKVGARKWLARIMISWGIVSGCMAFVQGPVSFLVIRFLLGAMEAGFFPGVILYLTFWYPKAYRARVTAGFMVSIPVSVVLGAPVSTYLLGLDGWLGYPGWKILFVLEALPSIVLGVVYLFILADNPAKAKWLNDAQRRSITSALAYEAKEVLAVGSHSVAAVAGMLDKRVLLLGMLYFCSSLSFWGLGFWLPTVLKQLGLSTAQVGWTLVIPYGLATIAMIAWSRHSDRTNERPWHFFLAGVLGALGMFGVAMASTPVVSVVAVSIAAIGVYMLIPIYWSYPPALVTGAAAASGFAVINSIGNLAGFVGPFFIGFIKDQTGGYALSFALMGCFLIVQAIGALVLGRRLFGRTATRLAVTQSTL